MVSSSRGNLSGQEHDPIINSCGLGLGPYEVLLARSRGNLSGQQEDPIINSRGLGLGPYEVLLSHGRGNLNGLAGRFAGQLAGWLAGQLRIVGTAEWLIACATGVRHSHREALTMKSIALHCMEAARKRIPYSIHVA